MANLNPPAAGADGAPPLAPIAPGARSPKSYRELFNDETYSPARERLANYLQGYRFSEDNVPGPAALRDQTVTLSDRHPSMAFLCLSAVPGGTNEVTVMHRLMRYMDMPGEEASGYDDRVLVGLLGDIMPHQYPAVEVPNTVLHLVGTPVRVTSTAAMVTLIPNWVDPNTPLGPFTEVDPETEVVRPRHVQLVPRYYAALSFTAAACPPKWHSKNFMGRCLPVMRLWLARTSSCGSRQRAPHAAGVDPRTEFQWYTARLRQFTSPVTCTGT
jgi:hypothetical protein